MGYECRIAGAKDATEVNSPGPLFAAQKYVRQLWEGGLPFTNGESVDVLVRHDDGKERKYSVDVKFHGKFTAAKVA